MGRTLCTARRSRNRPRRNSLVLPRQQCVVECAGCRASETGRNRSITICWRRANRMDMSHMPICCRNRTTRPSLGQIAHFIQEQAHEKGIGDGIRESRRRDAGAGRSRGRSDRRLQVRRLDRPLLGRCHRAGDGRHLQRPVRAAARPQDVRDLQRALAAREGRSVRGRAEQRAQVRRDDVEGAADLEELDRDSRRAEGRSRG